MHILGLEFLVFGVDDLPGARQFLLDYGLDELGYDDAEGGVYSALDGTGLVMRAAGDPSLPPLPPKAATPCLRETVYGVDNQATLEAIKAELERDRTVRTAADGSIHCLDDSGFGIASWSLAGTPITPAILASTCQDRHRGVRPTNVRLIRMP